MTSLERLMEENAALVALLNTIDTSPDTWSSIANRVALNGSAIRILEHDMDPAAHPLADDWRNGRSLESEPSLFDDDEIPPSEERRRQLSTAWEIARRKVSSWKDAGLDFVSVLDERYPNRLRQIMDMPPFLFADGTLIQDEQGVSVVGSRKATPEAIGFARDVASMLVSEKMTVIGGLAAGIDTAAHTQALADGGRTVAFIGTGITRQYPRENEYLQRDIARHGLVLSQFWPDQSATKFTFPIRNTSMSGYGVATVVVQAGEYSGTRIQARQAQRHGRPVILKDTVATGTEWGRKLTERPGVYVASSVHDVHEILREIINLDMGLEEAINRLIGEGEA